MPTDKISIIPADNLIVKNGKALNVTFTNIDPNIHAIQWNGQNGTVEKKIGGGQWFDDYEIIAGIVALWDAAEAAKIAAQKSE